MVQNGLESSLVVEVKEKQRNDPMLSLIVEAVQQQKVEVFSLREDDVLHYQGRLYVPNVDGLREKILAKAHGLKYSQPCATKMYRDL